MKKFREERTWLLAGLLGAARRNAGKNQAEQELEPVPVWAAEEKAAQTGSAEILSFAPAETMQDHLFEAWCDHYFIGQTDRSAAYSPVSLFQTLLIVRDLGDETLQKEFDALFGWELSRLEQKVNRVNAMAEKGWIRSGLWLDDSFTWNEARVNQAAKRFESLLSAATPAQNQKDMKQWIARLEDAELSKRMEIEPESFNVLALADCSADWLNPRMWPDSAISLFHAPDEDQSIQYLILTDEMQAGNNEKFAWVSVPLENGLSLRVFLPAEQESVRSMIADGTYLTFFDSPEAAETIMTRLYLPKIRILTLLETEQLLGTLEQNGVHLSRKTCFHGLTRESELKVGQLKQAVSFTVEEEGVKAKAVTQARAVPASAVIIDEVFTLELDRPFLFQLVNDDGTILFSGQYAGEDAQVNGNEK